MTKVTTNKLVDLLRRSNLVDEAKLTAFLEKAAQRARRGGARGPAAARRADDRGRPDHALAGRQAAGRQAQGLPPRQVQAARPDRQGRHEQRLSRRARAHEAARGDQGAAAEPRQRFVVPGAISPRSPGGRQARRSEHRPRLRHRQRRQHPLHRDGVRRRPGPAPDRRRAGAAAITTRPPITSPRWPTACSTPTKWASCTATSSRPTAWSIAQHR